MVYEYTLSLKFPDHVSLHLQDISVQDTYWPVQQRTCVYILIIKMLIVREY